jgi:hypothetical protein
MRRLLVLPAVLAAATAASAQSVPLTHKFAPGDMLQYSVSVVNNGELATPTQTTVTRNTDNALITLTFAGPDSATAVLNEFSSMMEGGPRGPQSRPGNMIVGKPFTLRVDPQGRVNLLASPIPDEMVRGMGVFGLFARALPVLPARAIKAGDTWADTVKNRKSKTPTGHTLTMNSITTFTVTSEAVVDGERRLFIEEKTTLKSELPGEQGNMPTLTVTNGVVNATMVYAPDRGRVVSYSRSEDMRASVQNLGANGGQTNRKNVIETRVMLK